MQVLGRELYYQIPRVLPVEKDLRKVLLPLRAIKKRSNIVDQEVVEDPVEELPEDVLVLIQEVDVVFGGHRSQSEPGHVFDLILG